MNCPNCNCGNAKEEPCCWQCGFDFVAPNPARDRFERASAEYAKHNALGKVPASVKGEVKAARSALRKAAAQ